MVIFPTDYIDRGKWDFECVLLLLSLKVLYPDKVFLLCGNHEVFNYSEHLKEKGFNCHLEFLYEDQILKDPSPLVQIWNVFRYFSIACIIDNRVFCVHGGIPRAVVSDPEEDIINYFRTLKKPVLESESPKNQILFDTLLVDPAEKEKIYLVDRTLPEGFFRDPSSRGGNALIFGMDVLDKFLERYHLQMLIRAHECMDRGLYVQNSCKMITVFSSSGYSLHNSAGVLLLYDNTIRFLTMSENPASGAPHSYPM